MEIFAFVETDLTSWRPSDESVNVFFANQSLHHIVNLEEVFDLVGHAMRAEGCFLIGDMIGRNGHMLWPEALTIVEALWSSLPSPKQHHRRLDCHHPIYPNSDFSSVGFEGIRAQDVLPLLVARFDSETFLGFSGIIRPFISRGYGPNYNPENETDAQFIRFVAALDDALIDRGWIKPTQCFAVFRKRTMGPVAERCIGNRTAKFCIRDPGMDS